MKNTLQNMYYGLLHLLVSFTAISVVTRIIGFNLPVTFLMAGIGTIIFHLVTQNKLPMVLGVSGVFIGGMIYVSQTEGMEYALGGVVGAGVLYVIFSLIAFKWQDKIMKHIPTWLLSTSVLLIALSLIPIGKSLVETNLVVGLATFVTIAIVELIGGKQVRTFAMPLGLLVGTLVYHFTVGLDFTTMAQPLAMEFMTPKFSLTGFLAISLMSIASILEMLGDTKNTGSIIGKNVFKEVGLGRIALGNGLSSIISGFGGGQVLTTYSENAGYLLTSNYFNPNAQLFTALYFIIMAFITPISKFIMMLPLESFGAIILYLYSLVAINSIKQIVESGVNLSDNRRVFVIMSIMVGVSSLAYVISGIAISSVAVAVAVGITLNTVIPKDK